MALESGLRWKPGDPDRRESGDRRKVTDRRVGPPGASSPAKTAEEPVGSSLESPNLKLEKVPDFVEAIIQGIRNHIENRDGKELDRLFNILPEPGTALAWPLSQQLMDASRDLHPDFDLFDRFGDKNVHGRRLRDWLVDTLAKREAGERDAMKRFIPDNHPSRQPDGGQDAYTQGRNARRRREQKNSNPYAQAEELIYSGLGVRIGAPLALMERAQKWEYGYDNYEVM